MDNTKKSIDESARIYAEICSELVEILPPNKYAEITQKISKYGLQSVREALAWYRSKVL